MKQHLAKHRKPKYTQSEDFHSQLTRLSFNIIWLSCAVIAVFLVVGITDQAFNTPRPQQTNLYPDPTGTGALEQYPLPSHPVVAPTTRRAIPPSAPLPSPAGMSTPMPARPSPPSPPHHSQQQQPKKKVQLPVPLPSATVVIVIPEPTAVPIPTPSPTCRRGNTDYGYSA